MAESKTDRDIFSKSGPSHIKSIDWTDLYHRTAVVASLVKGVYILQRLGPNSQAEPWWESFNFSLLEKLVDDDKDVIYGAIFEYQDTHLELSPRYVIAFRGTILKWETRDDLKLDLRIVFDELHLTSTVAHTIKEVKTLVEKHNNNNNNKDVWLVGHSLGAAIALLAGKTMIRKFGISLKTVALNPPISAIPLNQMIDSHLLKTLCQLCWTFIKAPLDWGHQEQNQEEDTNIASYIPDLYVNPADPVCSEYLGYFKYQKFMSMIGLSKIAAKAARITFRSYVFGRRGEGAPPDFSEERLHILASANMIKNTMVKSTKLKLAHGLHQWWEPVTDVRKKWEISSFLEELQ